MSDYDFSEIARIVASSQNIQEYKLDYQYATNKGDGYLGSVRAVQIIGKNKQLEVVFKYAHQDPKAHETLPLREAYTNEIKFYEVIAPAFAHFQAEHTIKDPFNNTADYYGCINVAQNECIALGNLKSLGYDLWDRKKQIDLPHFELALKTFAKFHGTSMAMKQINLKLYSNLSAGLDTLDVMKAVMNKAGFYNQMSTYIPTLNLFDHITENVYQEKLEHFRTNINSIIDPVMTYHDKYDAILQGDSWCNNLMFCYEDIRDSSRVKNMKILDWQIVKTGTVVIDLAYFFYTICSTEYMDNLEHFLKMYHNALADHLESFGLNVNDIYPYEIFWQHWQTFARYGLMFSFVLRRAMLIDTENAPDLANDLDTFVSNMYINSESEKIYKKQMKEIVMHFVDRKFI